MTRLWPVSAAVTSVAVGGATRYVRLWRRAISPAGLAP